MSYHYPQTINEDELNPIFEKKPNTQHFGNDISGPIPLPDGVNIETIIGIFQNNQDCVGITYSKKKRAYWTHYRIDNENIRNQINNKNSKGNITLTYKSCDLYVRL